jgi:eukaryotic-like serine/threonine-protein kinase
LKLSPRGPAPEAGRTFGSYRLIRELGRGGFGRVWEAESLENVRRLALKVITETQAASPEVLQRFEREGRLAASLNHPNCVYIFGAEEVDGYPVITMELMPGGTLQDLLRQRGRLPAKEAVDLILDVIEGLEAAHNAGILHRDVKPSNCFLDENGKAKIGDFGLSKTLELDSNVTISGAFIGTPSYASPEQVRGREIDFRSDIYSVGATLYALLTGEPPFVAKQTGEVSQAPSL